MYVTAGQGVAKSTTWGWRKIKLSEVAPAGDARLARSASPYVFERRSRSRSVTLVCHYRGGPECSWLVRVGPSRWRFPGWVCLEDVLSRVLGETTCATG
jgi:hypothetical protein